MRCSKCDSDNREGRKFCTSCGTPLIASCPKCGAPIEPGEKFCGECGAAILEPEPKAAPAPPRDNRVRLKDSAPTSEAVNGERKTVTALFADIKGSTELMRELDPEEARAVIDPVLQLMMDAVHRYDGYVVQSAGDGIFALFGAPVAHEDHPQRAVHAAIAMQQQLYEYTQQLATQNARGLKPVPLEVRIGINTGEVVLRLVHTGGHTEYTPVGHAANLAARMQSAATAGGTIISEDTRRLVEGYFELRELGPTEVKGVAQPINVYEVIGAGPLHGHFDLAVRRGLTKFVGRESELKQMAHALELARGGHGQVVAAVAEAGAGKSRLFYEFKATLPAESKVLEAYSVSHGKASAWLPVLELLHDYFGIQRVDDAETRREKVRAALRALDPALSDTHPYLFTLLALTESPDPIAQMDPGLKRQRTLDALKRIVLRESVKQPVVIIFEDLHWIDSHTQALLDLLADSLPNARVLLLVNYRPEYRHEWGNKSYYSQLRLDALDGRSASKMLASLLGDSAELDQLKQMVTERTGGNPFFIEEILRALFDEGALVRNGRVSVSRPLSQFRLPPTVQGILASRIDRQPGGHKQLLQTLAVLGMESTLGLIRQVSSMAESQLERTLSDLRAAEFIYEQPASVGVEYTFKHALTQEVAYNSVLSERRRQLHEQAAQAIETLSAANLADQYDDLAHHYGRSGNATKAVKYLHLAAQQSASRGAYAEAGNQLNHALELLQTQPEEMERDRIEIALRIDLNLFTKFSGVLGTAANMENLERAAQLCQHVGDDITRFHILEALADQYFSLADFQKCRTLSEEMLGIATRTLNPEFEGRARFMLGASFQWKGSLVAASEQLELACTLSAGASPIRESLGWNLSSRARLASGSTLWFLGFPERAMARNAEALAIERNMKALPSSMALTLFWSSLFQLSCARNWRIARAHCDEGLRLADEHGLVLMVPVFEFGRGWALARLGQVEEGFAEMRRGGGTFLGGALFRPTFFSGLADACLASGRWQEGLEAVEHAPGPEMRRLKGELLLMANQGSVAEATQCFLDALEMARHLRAKSWELRAAMSFARLLRDTGRRDEARTMLAQIYNWFTEGFDTADLKEAKALLDELAT